MIRRVLLCLFVVLISIGSASFAARSFTMDYLPGTEDTVDNMPANDSGTAGQVYNVSGMVPHRRGYEFIGWTLDYGVGRSYTVSYRVTGDPEYGKPDGVVEPLPVSDIPAGDDVILAGRLSAGNEEYKGPALYTVEYLEVGTDKVLAPTKNVELYQQGTVVTEEALDLDGYIVQGEAEQSITLRQTKIGKWTFTGWCSDEDCKLPVTEISDIDQDTIVYGKWDFEWEEVEKNEIIFYYARMITYVDYYVAYIDIDTGEKLIPDTVKRTEKGSRVIEHAPVIDGYAALNEQISVTIEEDETWLYFFYYENYPELSAYPEFFDTYEEADDSEQLERPEAMDGLMELQDIEEVQLETTESNEQASGEPETLELLETESEHSVRSKDPVRENERQIETIETEDDCPGETGADTEQQEQPDRESNRSKETEVPETGNEHETLSGSGEVGKSQAESDRVEKEQKNDHSEKEDRKPAESSDEGDASDKKEQGVKKETGCSNENEVGNNVVE